MHVRAIVELLSLIDGLLEGEDDGIEFGSLVRGHWLLPIRQTFSEGLVPAPFSHSNAGAGTKGSWITIASATTVNVHNHLVDHLATVEGNCKAFVRYKVYSKVVELVIDDGRKEPKYFFVDVHMERKGTLGWNDRCEHMGREC